jgi:hypothetical protein
LLGRANGTGEFLDDLYSLDLETLEWRLLSIGTFAAGKGPTSRVHNALVAEPGGERVYPFGGYEETGKLIQAHLQTL